MLAFEVGFIVIGKGFPWILLVELHDIVTMKAAEAMLLDSEMFISMKSISPSVAAI